eukprot:scaffold87028_cov61-Phaeocystis_antarctica.AAC.4
MPPRSPGPALSIGGSSGDNGDGSDGGDGGSAGSAGKSTAHAASPWTHPDWPSLMLLAASTAKAPPHTSLVAVTALRAAGTQTKRSNGQAADGRR